MHALILMPRTTRLEFALCGKPGGCALLTGLERPYRGDECMALEAISARAARLARPGRRFVPDVVALRSPFGGELFPGPARAGEETLEKLEGIAGAAPLHLPPLIALARACLRAWPETPCFIFFESSFFVNLPERERLYAVGREVGDGLRRFGCHGLYHAAACAEAARALFPIEKRQSLRALSFCLEPRPELAAVAGRRPLMTTSGLTPLEGLPGNGFCGDLDPGVIIMLNEKKKWGPERINRVLTEESGIRGLTSSGMTMEGLFSGAGRPAARRAVEYRFLLAAGKALAALNGFDLMVFSGRYARLGAKLGPALAERLAQAGAAKELSARFYIFGKPLSEILASLAIARAAGRSAA